MTVQPDAMPEVEDLEQQSELPEMTVKVRVVGPTLTHELPARIGTVRVEPLTTAASKVLYNDEKRKSALLVCASAFSVSRSGNGEFALWPANVPLPVGHCDEMWARMPSSTANLTVITEVWAD